MSGIDLAVVAPLVGAWIEIVQMASQSLSAASLPSWERGLKYLTAQIYSARDQVAPLVGAWIEI